MSQYAVDGCASLDLCPSDAITCWVEVYDRSPSEEGAVRLRCGYISDTVETPHLIKKLKEFLPLESWKELLICSPGDWLQARQLVRPEDLSMDMRSNYGRGPILQTELKLEGWHDIIFHNDSKGLGKQQLVIVRKGMYNLENWPKK